MKKIIVCILCFVAFLSMLPFKPFKGSAENVNDKLIRFHVIANSDSDSDQAVKLIIRDAVLKEIGPMLERAKTRDESMAIINKNVPEIEKTARAILEKEGKNYGARAMIGDFVFPIKKYGEVILPAGEYTALKIVLGNGDGKNWWCVMFPPLCFIDITRGLTSEVTDEELQRILDEDEIESITAFKQEPKNTELIVQAKSSPSTGTVNSQKPAKANSSQAKVEFKMKSWEAIKKTYINIINFFTERG